MAASPQLVLSCVRPVKALSPWRLRARAGHLAAALLGTWGGGDVYDGRWTTCDLWICFSEMLTVLPSLFSFAQSCLMKDLSVL